MSSPKHPHIQALETELAELQIARAEIDLDALWRELDGLKVEAAEFMKTVPRHGVLTESERRVSIAVSAAEKEMSNAKRRAEHLDSQIQPLLTLITAPERVAKAQAATDAAAGRKAAADAAVHVEQDGVEQLRKLLDTAKEVYAQQLGAVARDAVHAVRQGLAPSGATADTRQVVAMEAALNLAQEALVAAQADQTTIGMVAEQAVAQLREAQRDAARLHLEMHLHDFAPAIVEFRKVMGDRMHYLGDNFLAEELQRHVSRVERERAN
jgi:hypothetical protein